MNVSKLICALAVLAIAVGAHAEMYSVTNLGRLGWPGQGTYPNGLNESGQVVGEAQVGGGRHAFLWDSGLITDLDTSGGEWSVARDVNEAGQAVGWARNDMNHDRAILWQDGLMTDLGTLGGDMGRAYGINDSGQVVGGASTGSHGSAFLWDAETGMRNLMVWPGDTGSGAYALNNAGQVVGFSTPMAGISHALLWKGDTMTNLGTLGDEYSIAFDINESGQIVGSSMMYGMDHAFLWQNGVMQDLGGLLGHARATGINDAGVIVGTTWSPGFLERHSFIWRDGEVTNLNDLLPPESPYWIATVAGLNNSGQIIAEGVYFDEDGYSRPCGMLLTPIPEPGGLVLAVVGVGAVGVRRGR